jgi:hypothetical protein
MCHAAVASAIAPVTAQNVVTAVESGAVSVTRPVEMTVVATPR